MSTTPENADLAPALRWFAQRGWQPFAFQQEVWEAYLGGASGLVHASTGTGKTYAAWFGPLLEGAKHASSRQDGVKGASPLRVLWITPLRALAADTAAALFLDD